MEPKAKEYPSFCPWCGEYSGTVGVKGSSLMCDACAALISAQGTEIKESPRNAGAETTGSDNG